MPKKVTTGATVHDENEINAVIDVLNKSTQMGNKTEEFEDKVSSLFDKKFGIGVNSGSSALLLAATVLSEKYKNKTKKVITPVLTFSTTISSLLQNNFIPSFVDINLNTFNINVDAIEKAIDKDTVGLWIPNLIGNFPNLKTLREIANKHKLFYLEDSADTIGGTFDGHSSGTYADFSTTSFYGSHVINCAGNGGMFCTNDENISNMAKIYRSWGRSSSIFGKNESEDIKMRFEYEIDGIPSDRKFIFEKIGYNLEPNEVGCAYGVEQLKKLENNIEKRRKNFQFYNNSLSKITDLLEFPKELDNVITGWLSYPLTIKENKFFKRKDLMIFLENNNIQTRTVFTGNILRQPGFKDIYHDSSYNKFPIADNIMRNSFLIGLHHGLVQEDLEYVIKIFKEFFQRF